MRSTPVQSSSWCLPFILLLPRRAAPKRTGSKKNSSKMWQIFEPQKRGVKAPRLPRNSPQLHHKNTTTCTPFFPKTPAKTPLHHPSKNLRQILRRNRFSRRLRVPEDVHHPITVAVLEKLEAIDTTCERRSIVQIMPRLISAPNLHNVAKPLDFIVDRAFKESITGQTPIAALNVSINSKKNSIAMRRATIGRRRSHSGDKAS